MWAKEFILENPQGMTISIPINITNPTAAGCTLVWAVE
jgi:hypothetical protein